MYGRRFTMLRPVCTGGENRNILLAVCVIVPLIVYPVLTTSVLPFLHAGHDRRMIKTVRGGQATTLENLMVNAWIENHIGIYGGILLKAGFISGIGEERHTESVARRKQRRDPGGESTAR